MHKFFCCAIGAKIWKVFCAVFAVDISKPLSVLTVGVFVAGVVVGVVVAGVVVDVARPVVVVGVVSADVEVVVTLAFGDLKSRLNHLNLGNR